MSELKNFLIEILQSKDKPENEPEFAGFHLGTPGIGRKFEKIHSIDKYIWINHDTGEIDHIQDIIEKDGD